MAPERILYKRSRFTTRLPRNLLYTPSHGWLKEVEEGRWHVGLTQFATRMLGDLVEFEFRVSSGDRVGVGQEIGWIEGFKAVSNIYSVAEGEFGGSNPGLGEDVTLLETDPDGRGWLYQVCGRSAPNAMDVHAYMGLLDATIDQMLKRQRDQGGGEVGPEESDEKDCG